MLHQSAFLVGLRNGCLGTEGASPTSVPHFLVDRPFAVVWLYFSWLPRWRDSFRALGGSLFGVPSTDRGSRLRDMSNFCCLPGRAGGTPLLVRFSEFLVCLPTVPGCHSRKRGLRHVADFWAVLGQASHCLRRSIWRSAPKDNEGIQED